MIKGKWFISNFKLIALLLAGMIICMSCSTKKKKNQVVIPENGKVIADLKCAHDRNKSYALYLPSYYSDTARWPVIIAFDSHGKGLLPVELFRDAAERFGYILVGLNNSKNGLEWSVVSEIYDTLLSDVQARFSIDEQRIYAAGFSGGARVAGNIAIMKGGINTVIGCGAGLSTHQKINNKFGFYGIAGREDMNLNELTALDSALQNAGYDHYLRVFDGKHEWPPKAIASEAILWLEFRAMNKKLKPLSDTLVNNTFKRWSEAAMQEEKAGKLFDAYQQIYKLINYFDGLKDIEALKSKMAALKGTKVVESAIKSVLEIQATERNLQQYYTGNLATQSIQWWETQVGMIGQKIKTAGSDDLKFMYKRVLNYLSLAVYMNINAMMKAGDYTDVNKYNIIYKLVDPENSEHAYISAILAMKDKKPQDALKFLEEAAALGFSDIGRLESDTIMTTLKQQDGYSKLAEKIKANTLK